MNGQEPAPDDLWGEPSEADEWFELIGIPWREISPEEYAARHSHNIYCLSLEHLRFRDPELATWARRFHEILFNRAEAVSVLPGRQPRQLLVEDSRTAQAREDAA